MAVGRVDEVAARVRVGVLCVVAPFAIASCSLAAKPACGIIQRAAIKRETPN